MFLTILVLCVILRAQGFFNNSTIKEGADVSRCDELPPFEEIAKRLRSEEVAIRREIADLIFEYAVCFDQSFIPELCAALNDSDEEVCNRSYHHLLKLVRI